MKNIQNLLDKYFDEQTSPQEEAELRAYFAGDVAAEFEMYKPIFEFVQEEQKVALGADFEANLIGNIITELTEQYFAGETSLEDEQTLREYYTGENVAAEHEVFKPIFKSAQEEQKATLGADFEANLFGNIITDLTDQYFAGETSLEDEQTLREYYTGENIAPELQKYQSWFAFLEVERTATTSANFEDKVLTEIKGKSSQMRVVSRRKTWLRAIAAGVALMIGAWMFFPKAEDISGAQKMAATDQIDWSKYEITEESAPEEVEEAMRLLAKAFNKGSRKASKDLNKVGQATRVLN
jgi:hypothetical protein